MYLLMCLVMISCSHEIGSSQLHDAPEATQQASPQPRRRHHKDSGVDSANVVPEKRPRKKNIPYTPGN
jgi:hypothetical protein